VLAARLQPVRNDREGCQALIEEHEGHLCVRFYKRADRHDDDQGLPVGWRRSSGRRAVRRRRGAFVVAAFSMLTLGVLAGSVRANGNGGFFASSTRSARADWLIRRC